MWSNANNAKIHAISNYTSSFWNILLYICRCYSGSLFCNNNKCIIYNNSYNKSCAKKGLKIMMSGAGTVEYIILRKYIYQVRNAKSQSTSDKTSLPLHPGGKETSRTLKLWSGSYSIVSYSSLSKYMQEPGCSGLCKHSAVLKLILTLTDNLWSVAWGECAA